MGNKGERGKRGEGGERKVETIRKGRIVFLSSA